MKHYVFSLVDTDETAQEVTERIADAGFAKEELFVLTSGRGNASERGSLNEGTGLLAGIGPTVAGGSGHFMGTGRIMDASNNEEIGVEEGAGTAFLGRFGMSEAEARQYQSKLAEGGILIAVQVDGKKTAMIARKIFEDAHCQEISET
jgi:hypothetical protein